jgi:hypothetical protein
MKTLKQKFNDSVIEYLSDINSQNFENRYQGLIDIVLNYQKQGISKQDASETILELGRTDLNSGQDEILLEISCRIDGFCTSGKEIKW